MKGYSKPSGVLKLEARDLSIFKRANAIAHYMTGRYTLEAYPHRPSMLRSKCGRSLLALQAPMPGPSMT